MPKLVHSSLFRVQRKKTIYHELPTTHFKVKPGFTLLEILLSLFLIIAIILMLISTSGTYLSSRSSNLRGIAGKIASRQIESLRKMDYDSLPATGAFADSDLSKLPQSTASQTLTSYHSSPDIKLVTVQVSWSESGAAKLFSEDTLIYRNGLK